MCLPARTPRPCTASGCGMDPTLTGTLADVFYADQAENPSLRFRTSRAVVDAPDGVQV